MSGKFYLAEKIRQVLPYDVRETGRKTLQGSKKYYFSTDFNEDGTIRLVIYAGMEHTVHQGGGFTTSKYVILEVLGGLTNQQYFDIVKAVDTSMYDMVVHNYCVDKADQLPNVILNTVFENMRGTVAYLGTEVMYDCVKKHRAVLHGDHIRLYIVPKDGDGIHADVYTVRAKDLESCLDDLTSVIECC
jgi:hypothetical protein